MAEGSIEKKEEVTKSPADRAAFWKAQVEAATKEQKDWAKVAKNDILPRYKDIKKSSGQVFNIFWSNVETLKPVVYSSVPKPYVKRRYLDKDPVGRQAAELLERGLEFCLDDPRYDFSAQMEAARDDKLIVGRGHARVKYSAEMAQRPVDIIKDGLGNVVRYEVDGAPVQPEFDSDDLPFIEEKVEEAVSTEYVYWQDFLMSPARQWGDVWWVSFKHQMPRDGLIEEFGDEIGARVPLVITPGGTDTQSDDRDSPDDNFGRAKVWEIWDKSARRRIWIAEGYDGVLREDEDPLNLENFFPCPKPVYAISTTDTMVPIAEFTRYQDQAKQLDVIEERIAKLTGSLKAVGLYDTVAGKTINLLKDLQDGELHPIDTGQQLREGGGLRGAIFMNPVETYSTVLANLYVQRQQLKETIYEITGISDIIRGSTRASETLGAQDLKSRFGAMRMTPRSRPMQLFVRDLLRIKAEVMAEQFSPDTWTRMTGLEARPEVLQLLRDDRARGFRIDIETDSTVRDDILEEKRDVTEFVTAVTQFLQAAGTVGAATPLATPMLMELLKFSVRRFKAGRQLETVIENTTEMIMKQMQQSMSQPPPVPPELQIKAEDVKRKAKQDDTEAQQAREELAFKREEAGLGRAHDTRKTALKGALDIEAADRAAPEAGL